MKRVSIDEFKKSDLNGLGGSYGDGSDYECPNCGDYLEEDVPECSGYDIMCHGICIGLSCPTCEYEISVTGNVSYLQKKDKNDNWINVTEEDDDTIDEAEWEIYYDEELDAIAYEITDSENHTIRYIINDPIIEKEEGHEVDEKDEDDEE